MALQDFDCFYVRQPGDDRIVVFRYSWRYRGPGKGSLTRPLDHWDGHLITVGMTAEDQAELLNGWLEQYSPKPKARALKDPGESTDSRFRGRNGDGRRETLRLRPSSEYNRGSITVFGVMLFSMFSCTYQAWDYRWARLFLVGMIGLSGLAVAYLCLELQPDRAYLELTPAGLVRRSPLRRRVSRWGDYASFFVREGNPRFVAFRYSGCYRGLLWERPIRYLSRGVRGCDGLLIYAGMAAEDQANLLNDWRERYGRKPSPAKELYDDWVGTE